jgi:hypothetical protein
MVPGQGITPSASHTSYANALALSGHKGLQVVLPSPIVAANIQCSVALPPC